LAKGTLDFSRVEEWFKSKFNYVPSILSPDNKRHEAALRMALQNAEEDIRKRVRERGGGPGLNELARVLKLNAPPLRIEGFDIAQLDGKHPYASLIAFKNGIPDRKNYRLFRLRSVEGIVDDFQAMREAVSRRYSRLVRETADLPDLILIDGGIGQVNAALSALGELGLSLPVVGLAKENEELWLPGAKTALALGRDNEALKILIALRDETHRFATNANQKARSRELSLQSLCAIDGIGEKTAALILKKIGSLKNIALLNAAQLSNAVPISLKCAQKVIEAVRKATDQTEKKKQRLQKDGSRIRTHDAEKERKAAELVKLAAES
jgi:excinuclease ABC subunit C